MINRTALSALSTLAAALLAACTTAGAAPFPLAGSTWSLVLIDGQKPVSSRAALTINAKSLSANAGCNGMSGDLVITPNRLKTVLIPSTLLFCDGVMEQEKALNALLHASPHYKVEGDTLTLTAPGHSARLARKR